MSKSLPLPSFRTSRRWTETEARAALTALAASRLSIPAFALREGINAQRLYLWRQKLERPVVSSSVSPSPFVEVRSVVSERSPGSDHVELVLRSGRILRCAEGIDPSALRRFIRILEEESGC